MAVKAGVNVPALGITAAIASRFLANQRTWKILNTDTGQTVEGDFEASDINRTVSSNWAVHHSLNQRKPVLQFLSGNADKLSFRARVFASHAFDKITEKFQTLVAWVQRDPDLSRPPIVLFSVGDGDDAYFDNALAVIESVSDIQYDSPTVSGTIRGISFTINLLEYTEYSLENIPPPETRYAHAKTGEYMELLAVREYGEPLLGDVIRDRHPALQIVSPGDIVKLPSLAAIQDSVIAPRSIAFQTMLGNSGTDQQTLRSFFFDRNNRSYKSTIVPAGL